MKLIWHIDRARFEFSDPSEIEQWAENPSINFEFSPDQSDDGGSSVFADPDSISAYFEVTEEKGSFKHEVESDAVVVSAWVKVHADVVDDFSEDVLDEWSSDMGGWASCSIDLGGDYDAYITEDDGGDWRLG